MPAQTQSLDFLLDNFLTRVPHVAHIIAVSDDGLLIAADTGLPRDAADRLSAMCSGLLSLLKAAGNELGAGTLSHSLADYEAGFVMAMASPDGACLLLLADRECDLGQVSFEMTDLVNRVGDALTPVARTY